ncbi:hypothetical protein QYM36_003325 [Artemia franciscana]|uniref:Tubulin-specific chaperone D n=1 Tax=Artemia franciscana TaxID=6661 RepID=A0AA88LG13_ARTSF|nr:hypothetical protein QYM36_003325 [Artemia franciscana]
MDNDLEEPIGLACAKIEFSEKDTLLAAISKIGEENFEKRLQDFTTTLNLYQEQPHLLDPSLPEFIGQLLLLLTKDVELRRKASKFIYVLMKVRGFKRALKCFPHEVSDLEVVLNLLKQESPGDIENWEVSYVLLLWLSLIILIPFDLKRFDDGCQEPLITRVINIIKTYLKSYLSSQEAAAYLASVYLTRPDVKEIELLPFISWCQEVLLVDEIRPRLGVLRALSSVFKRGRREDLISLSEPLFRSLSKYNLMTSTEIMLRKLYLKLVQRIGLCVLKSRVAKWRYQRGSRSLAINLLSEGTSQGKEIVDEDIEEDSSVPELLEEVVDSLLNGLRDCDTVVRWSSAKGIGRIANRLQKHFVGDVLSSVLDLFTVTEADSAWHGGCLALAELGRRGLLLPERLSEVIPLLLKALTYDELRGSFSVGRNIRDAACYVCWSFARAYDPAVLAPFLDDLARGLLITAVFDREINCRRAAAAAFQEHVGRQGALPHGIDILTTVDYFSVGMKPHAYLELSCFVGKYPEYTASLIDHLMEFKVGHWDLVIRDLTAKALRRLTHLAPEYIIANIIPVLIYRSTIVELYLRHGSILALSEIFSALSEIARTKEVTTAELVGRDLAQKSIEVTITLSTGRFLSGLGSDITKQALCYLIRRCCEANLCPKDGNRIDVWQSVIDISLQDKRRAVQKAAATALHSFASIYYTDSARSLIATKKCISSLLSKNQDFRCGYALALCEIPPEVMEIPAIEVIEALKKCTEITSDTEKWTDTRQYSLRALSIFCINYFEKIENYNNVASEVLQSFLKALGDYTADSRGDIGAGVRETAMDSIKEFLLFCVSKTVHIEEDLVVKIFQSIVQQAMEKIDRTRNVAGSVFCKLLHNEPRIPNIPEYELLLANFPKDDVVNINWATPTDAIPRFVQLLVSPVFCKPEVLGLVSTVGGLTASLVRCLFYFLNHFLMLENVNKFCRFVMRNIQ